MIDLSRHALETLSEDGEFKLVRAILEAGGPESVLLVAPVSARPTQASLARLEQELALRHHLDEAWSARPRSMQQHEGRPTLFLNDPGGELLARHVGQPWKLGPFLDLAVGLASALGAMHERGLIHKDLKPSKILVDRATGKSWLTGFSIASLVPRERKGPESPEMIAGTLAYMAPEQTGRMNRSIDSRSDLYSLGVTLCQALTGKLPFAASDPMEWIHCHIAREPLLRHEGSPEVVVEIIKKLLAKDPEDRYQTAAGLAADLRRCAQSWNSGESIPSFPLASRDDSAQLSIPEKLYGREAETARILAAFERTVVSTRSELVLVSGYSGVGKSSVVNELHRALVPARALFASGKFDQYKRDIPYATLAQAFQSLVRQILSKSNAEVAAWRAAFKDAIGQNGQLIVDLIPEFELVVGEQPPVSGLPPAEARHRFQLIMCRFLGVFAQQQHPLVLFLDDLQWLDRATLDLLDLLLTSPDVGHLLLIGAYRDNEVGASHPLAEKLSALRAGATPVQEIRLSPLELSDIGQLVADSLRSPREESEALAELVHERAGGNPFFVIQFLTSLADGRLLAFEPVEAAWRWDLARIRRRAPTENVVSLMIEKLSRLPENTERALQVFACLGNVAPISTLRLVLDCSEAELHGYFWEVVRSGLLLRQGDAYAFLHDRVQEAAYALLPSDDRATTHLHIGRRLLSGLPTALLEENSFEIAGQLNRGSPLMDSEQERLELARLNLSAGKRAKAGSAYSSASNYLTAGCALLPRDSWERCHELTRELYLQRAECEILNANFDVARGVVRELLGRSVSKAEKAQAYRLDIELSVLESENAKAVEQALECLRLFQIDMPAHPSAAELDLAYQEVRGLLDQCSLEELVNLPRAVDGDTESAMSVLSMLFAPAAFTDGTLLILHLCHMVRLTLERGVTAASTHAFGWFGVMLQEAYGRYEEGYRFGKLARALVERHGFVAFEAKTLFSLELVGFWTSPISAALTAIRAAFRWGVETGDITVACFSCNHAVTDMLVRGDALQEVWSETERGLAFARRAKYRDVADIIVAQQRFIRNMLGQTLTFSTFDDAEFDELEFERELTPDRMATMIFWYWAIKGQARFISRDFAVAADAFERAEKLSWSSPSHIQNLDYHYFGALTLAARQPRSSSHTMDPARRERLGAHLRQLASWAESYPPTFSDKQRLVAAELARIEGADAVAIRLYEEAVQLARQHGFIQNEAIANEVCAHFYLECGVPTAANAYLAAARYCYERWGASGKVAQLDELFPQLREPSIASPGATLGTSSQQLDLVSVIEISRAISSEMVLENVTRRLMTIALEHAGAARGLLVLARGEELRIEAEAVTERETIAVQIRQTAVASNQLPESVLRYVARTLESVIIDDASAAHAFSSDEYFERTKTRSVLFLPLVKQATLVGVLYLENDLTSHAFSKNRSDVLQLVAAQAAISIEKARLYDELSQAETYLAEAQRLNRTGSFGWRVETGEITWSEEMYRIFACDPGSKPSLELILQRTHPLDLSMVDGLLKRKSSQGEDWDLQHRLQLPDGSTKHVHVVARAIESSDGNVELVGAVTDVTATKRVEEQLQASLEEKEALLKEIHHRVKNNLQLISSLLSLQASGTADPSVAERFEDSRNRVRSMALVHENLYRAGNFARIRMAPHIEGLCTHLASAYALRSHHVRLVYRINDLHLDVDKAMSCGLIVNELVSNALKHAFPQARPGLVAVELTASDQNQYALLVEDDGIGLPVGLNFSDLRSLGLQLVQDLTKQLRGSLTVKRERGTAFKIVFDAHASSANHAR
ncbi:MAG: AAA family ATPase [Pseudomonadota bacterium]